MKNITLAVDENDPEAVRIDAAERKTTVNAIVRDHRAQIARRHMRTRAAMARLRALSEQSGAQLGPDYRFDRDSLHER